MMDSFFVNPQLLLVNLIPAILDPENLLIKGNKKEPLTGLQYKEALGIFILSETMNYSYNSQIKKVKFDIISADYEDTNNDDGMLLITFKESDHAIITYLEQVSVTTHQKGDITIEVLKQIEKKHRKYSEDYYRNRILLIFTDKIGQISIESVKESLRMEKKFYYYALFCLERFIDNIYIYTVVNINHEVNYYKKFIVEIDTIKQSYKLSNG